ncbi:MAG: DUF998 domain-containing protein [Nitrososphaerales archaeon]|nr:DUF998 domain-containing protein [Nitrososphaerales archaeon]
MAPSNPAKAGTAFVIGGVQFTILWMLAEVFYPGYSVKTNYISDLGTTCHSPGSCYVPPAWWMFNASEVIFGVLIAVGAYFFFRAYRYKPATVMIAVAGVALIGVGIFNESWSPWHSLFSLVTFLFAGLSAIATFRFQKAPLSYISVLLGAVTLLSLILYIPDAGAFGNTIGVGAGGLERLIVYPALLWGISFGGYLLGQRDLPV